MPGLISQNIDQNNPLGGIKGYDAERVTMGDSDTVEKRITNLLRDENPLIQLNKTKARQGAARRGLLLSLIHISEPTRPY